MSGANRQVSINTGGQSLFVNGNPQITFFQAVYRRHTNFAIESINLTGNTVPEITGGPVTYTMPKGTGELISNMWVEAKLTAAGTSKGSYVNWTNNTGAALIKECEIKIGSHSLEKHTSLWYDVSNELMDHGNREHMSLNKHPGRNTYLRSNTGKLPNLHLNIPLKFWFNRNVGMALPVCALQQTDVKMKITYRNLKFLINKSSEDHGEVITIDPPSSDTIKLYADYIFLDTDEKMRFKQGTHEYLIEQVDINEDNVYENSLKLNFSHPVKELIWVIRSKDVFKEVDATIQTTTTVDSTKNNNLRIGNSFTGTAQSNDYFNYSLLPMGSTDTVEDLGLGYLYTNNFGEWFSDCKLHINGSDRFEKRNPYYFRTIQPIQSGHNIPSKHIYCYSFSINPEEHQPSGTINYTRVESSKLDFSKSVNKNTNAFITVFAIYYNVLRISGGRGGIAYSN